MGWISQVNFFLPRPNGSSKLNLTSHMKTWRNLENHYSEFGRWKHFRFRFTERKYFCPWWIRSGSLWVWRRAKGEAESGGDLPNKHPICFSDNIWIKLEILVWSQKTRFETSKEIFGEEHNIDVRFMHSLGKEINKITYLHFLFK